MTKLGNYDKNEFKIVGTTLVKYLGAGGAVVIPDGVTEIGEHAFSQVERLKSVTMPSSVKKIGFSAFNWCKSLTSVVIPEGVREIADCAFADDTSLREIALPSTVERLGIMAFGESGLREISIPAGTTIDERAFEKCKCLKSVVFESGDADAETHIGEKAFFGCDVLRSVTLSANVRTIGNEAFCCCSRLRTIDIPEGVEQIGWLAFEFCNMESIAIPRSVREVGGIKREEIWIPRPDRLEDDYDIEYEFKPYHVLFNYGTSLKTVRLPEGFKYGREELGIPDGAEVVYY